MDSPLLETTVSGATDIIVNFSGNIGIVEAYDAITYLTEVAGDGANIIFGTVDNDVMGEDVCITIIATGIEGNQRAASAVSVPSSQTSTASASKPTVMPLKTPTYSGQPLAPSTPKPSYSTTPKTAAPDFSSPVTVKPQGSTSGIKIPDFLKRG